MELELKEILLDISTLNSRLKIISLESSIPLRQIVGALNNEIENSSMWFLKNDQPKIGLKIFEERSKDGSL